MAKDHQISAKLDKESFDLLTAFAKADDRSVSHALRIMIKEFCKKK